MAGTGALRRTRSNPQDLAPVAIILACTISSAIWILSDQRVWWWDQAAYGYWTLRLWHAGLSGIGDWGHALLHVLGAPPLMIWLAQLLVPLRWLTGEFESAMLFVNLFASAATLALVYRTSRNLGANVVAGVCAVMLCAGSGLFIGLTHTYMVEMTQCCAAAAMISIAWRSERRPRVRTAGLLLVGTALSMLSKSSSFVFVLPTMTYVAVALLVARHDPRPKPRATDALLLIVSIMAAGITVIWYLVNWNSVVQHFLSATLSDYTLHWGSPVNFPVKIRFWTGWFLTTLSPFPLLSLVFILIVASSLAVSLARLLKRASSEWLRGSVQTGTLLALALAGMILATLLAFSLQINEDVRFLMPLLPAAGVLLGWSLTVIGNRIANSLMATALALNLALHHAYAHGHNPLGVTPHGYLAAPDPKTQDKILLTEAVRSTCGPRAAGRSNFIAVNYVSLNANAINFYAEKERDRRGYACPFDGFRPDETNVDRALDRISALAPAFIVTVAPEKQPSGPWAPAFANMISRGVSEYLTSDPQYALAAGSGDYLKIYQKVDPPK